jgi:uncharacterized protein YyaL (SSP411 family)
MVNRLADELSPYLRQHAGNPVEWFPWGSEAIALARREQKPIFLSIGYAACHWCHVMAHESFEDAAIARQLAEGFVSVKVDREERPDLDQLYMEAVQMMTGHGGWPMSVFLTPELEPFFGGTYWPAQAKRGMPGFDDVLRAVAAAWRERRPAVLAQAAEIVRLLRESDLAADDGAPLDDGPLLAAERAWRQTFDPRHGGFGGAPKFPPAIALALLLRRWRRLRDDSLREMTATTLDAMAAGGIYDHLGGGFHRYSVDDRWLVPHFEKMLYDNALLAGCYLEAHEALGEPRYATVARETLDYVLRDLSDSQGGFYSSEDADSEGVEGRFYVWTPAEIGAALGPAAGAFCKAYDVTAAGNFEGHNILNLAHPMQVCARMLDRRPDELEAELTAGRATLRAVRDRRVRPGRDDKVLTNWNALMIESLARAGRTLGDERYTAAAERAADFLLTQLRGPDGRLLHCWRAGRAKVNGFLDDYAGLANALLTLYETTAAARWLDAATALADELLARFADRQGGGFFFTPDDHEPLPARKKDALDSSTPSGNGLAATLLVRLGQRLGRDDYRQAAEGTLRAFGPLLRQMPVAAAQMLTALDMYRG